MRILEPGMLTTVQDLGRPGFASLGVPQGGAADSLSLRIANRLVGNPDSAACLECTLTGALIQFNQPATIALAGGTTTLSSTSTPSLELWKSHAIAAGEQLRIGPIKRGCRVYLAIRGGILVPRILNSSSTLLSAAFGGHQGRPLRVGDQLQLGEASQPSSPRVCSLPPNLLNQHTFRAIEQPLADHFDHAAAARFWESEFTISNHSDRAGLRLEGSAIPTLCRGRMPSQGMIAGAIQVPESGQPIILGVDHPTTGGYPVIACIASVDLPALGQLTPRNIIRFEKISIESARARFAEREQSLAKALPQVRSP